jgi:glutamyl-tRNA reductase
MMKLVLYSVNHHNCPVEAREKLSFTEQQRQFCLRKMCAEDQISEAVILSSCNRSEFYIYAKESFDCDGFLTTLIGQVLPAVVDVWCKYSRASTGIEAVRHLFEVTAGLDSQIIGENQILSQVKSAYRMSLDCRMSKFIFHRLFHSAFRAGKAVRSDTNINCGAVSVSLTAVELAKEKIELPFAAAMVIGAGENAELAARYLLKGCVGSLVIANRDSERAEGLVLRLKAGEVIGLADIAEKLAEVDLVISSTGAAEPIVTYRQVADKLADRTKPLVIIDIAVPRDIEADIGRFECVCLYNIDDLNEQMSRNKQKRRLEIPKARRIVDEFTDKFIQWQESLKVVPVISQLTQKAIELADSEARRYAKDFSKSDRDKLKLFAESLVKKVLHGPISFLKNGADEEFNIEQLRARDLINKMFFSQSDKR